MKRRFLLTGLITSQFLLLLVALTNELPANADSAPGDTPDEGNGDHGEGDHGDDHGKDSDHKHSWGYGGEVGEESWGEECTLNKNRQSPIDIITETAVYNRLLTDISLLEKMPADATETDFTMINNGHSVAVKINHPVFLTGGNLGDIYKADSFHFHWGSTNLNGSEHFVNGKQYPLELHIVHYDTEKHTDLKDALSGTDSLAVLGILYEISEEDNAALEPIIVHLDSITATGATKQIPTIDLSTLLPSNTRDYFRYEGSLTTPPCNEIVLWTVFRTKNSVSEKQLEKFRHILVDNWRKPKDTGASRVVSRSFVTSADDEPVVEEVSEEKQEVNKKVPEGPKTKESVQKTQQTGNNAPSPFARSSHCILVSSLVLVLLQKAHVIL